MTRKPKSTPISEDTKQCWACKVVLQIREDAYKVPTKSTLTTQVHFYHITADAGNDFTAADCNFSVAGVEPSLTTRTQAVLLPSPGLPLRL